MCVCVRVVDILSDCSGSFFHLVQHWEMKKEEIREGGIQRVRCHHFEIPLSNDGFPTETLRLCPPFSPIYVCLCVCMSGEESVVSVLLSAPGVSLVSYQPQHSLYSTQTVRGPFRTVHEPHSNVFWVCVFLEYKARRHSLAWAKNGGATSKSTAATSKCDTWIHYSKDHLTPKI